MQWETSALADYSCLKGSSGRRRKLRINQFSGKLLVDMREFYTKDGKELPGKKGANEITLLMALTYYVSVAHQMLTCFC